MIKLIDILNEIKVENPNNIEVVKTRIKGLIYSIQNLKDDKPQILNWFEGECKRVLKEISNG
jgi:hypothetical protein